MPSAAPGANRGQVRPCGVADVCTDLASDFGRHTLRSTTNGFP
jgi:hypothetical protein